MFPFRKFQTFNSCSCDSALVFVHSCLLFVCWLDIVDDSLHRDTFLFIPWLQRVPDHTQSSYCIRKWVRSSGSIAEQVPKERRFVWKHVRNVLYKQQRIPSVLWWRCKYRSGLWQQSLTLHQWSYPLNWLKKQFQKKMSHLLHFTSSGHHTAPLLYVNCGYGSDYETLRQ